MKKCFDGGPSKEEPVVVECIVCNDTDDDCGACGGTGEIEIPHCPYKLVDEDVIELLDMAAHMEAGSPPVLGGVGDQTEWFLTAVRYVKSERSRREAEAAERK